jgi:hypothetical protein
MPFLAIVRDQPMVAEIHRTRDVPFHSTQQFAFIFTGRQCYLSANLVFDVASETVDVFALLQSTGGVEIHREFEVV